MLNPESALFNAFIELKSEAFLSGQKTYMLNIRFFGTVSTVVYVGQCETHGVKVGILEIGQVISGK